MLVTVDDCGNISDQVVNIPGETTDDVLEKLSILLNAQLCHQQYHNYEQNFISTRPILSRYQPALTAGETGTRAVNDPDTNSIFLEGFSIFSTSLNSMSLKS